jgi:predicted DCC family thiol-disulfide oxidoreductase YuxK
MTGVLFFDGACGMCTRARDFLVRHDRTGNVETEPLQSAGVAERLGIPHEQVLEAMRWLDTSGAVYTGHPTAIVVLPHPRHPAGAERRLPLGRRPPLPLPRHDAVLRVAPGGLLN